LNHHHPEGSSKCNKNKSSNDKVNSQRGFKIKVLFVRKLKKDLIIIVPNKGKMIENSLTIASPCPHKYK
jgi:hypothetical protein